MSSGRKSILGAYCRGVLDLSRMRLPGHSDRQRKGTSLRARLRNHLTFFHRRTARFFDPGKGTDKSAEAQTERHSSASQSQKRTE
eukprot:8640066-Pyramimonas_sp.AAC.1